jgi:hypothetical protein
LLKYLASYSIQLGPLVTVFVTNELYQMIEEAGINSSIEKFKQIVLVKYENLRQLNFHALREKRYYLEKKSVNN